jgi:hypothetical protein
MASDDLTDFQKWEGSILDFGGAIGFGTLAHATASANRKSNMKWGLDWKRMANARGIAGSGQPELEAVFLDHLDGIDFFTAMSRQPCDVWEVDVTGLWIEMHEDWLIHRSPITPDRLRLIAKDLPPRTREWTAP